MSCLLPFPYTPKPNEQSGACLPCFYIALTTTWLLHGQAPCFRMPSLPLLPLLLPPLTSLSKWQFSLLCFQQSQWSKLCSLTTEQLADNDLAYSQRIRSDLWFSHGIYTWTHKCWVLAVWHTAESHKHVYLMCIGTHHVQTNTAFIDWFTSSCCGTTTTNGCVYSHLLEMFLWNLQISDLSKQRNV